MQYPILDEVHSEIKLFATYAKTKDTEVAKHIEGLMQQLRAAGTDMWNPALDSDWMKNLYKGMPFWMAYETIFHGKGNYLDILNIFRGIRSAMFSTEKRLYRSVYDANLDPEECEYTLRDSACMMTIFVDVMSRMSIEIFEQYKEMEGFLKETLKGILASPKAMDQVVAYQDDDCEEEEDVLGSVMLAYAILKGCGTLGALSAEHYQELGESILEALFDRVDLQEAADYISGRI